MAQIYCRQVNLKVAMDETGPDERRLCVLALFDICYNILKMIKA